MDGDVMNDGGVDCGADGGIGGDGQGIDVAGCASLEAWARDAVAHIVEHAANEADLATVHGQLGRFPRGMVAVGARCVCGEPLAVVTRPELDDGTPFPTTCYLTSPQAVKAVSHLEAEGVMGECNRLLQEDTAVREAYGHAHCRYLAFRHALAQRLGDGEGRIAGISAGGMPVRVKCLHALLAQTLVMGPGVNPIGDMVLRRVAREFDPAVCRCAPAGDGSPVRKGMATEGRVA